MNRYAITALFSATLIAASSATPLQAKPLQAAPANSTQISGRSASNQITICAEASKGNLVPLAGLNNWLFLDSEFHSNKFASENQYEPLRRFSEALWDRGIKLVTIPIPSRPAVIGANFDLSNPIQAKFDVEQSRAGYNESVTTFRRGRITTVNVLEAMRDYIKNGGKENPFFIRDFHWTPTGSRITADATSREVKAWSTYYNSLPKVDYVNQPTRMYDFKGNISGILEELCKGTQLPPETAQGFAPVRQGKANLLNEERIEVTLAASSFGGPPFDANQLDFNLTGFLEENLKASIINAGIAGGGYDSSLESYLMGPEYERQKPKFLLYEFRALPLTFVLSSFRRIIPSVYGPCPGSKAIFNGSSVSFKDGASKIILNPPASLGIKGSSRYISLRLSDPKVMRFNAFFTYDDGQSEVVPVERSERYKNNDGRFLLELSDKFRGNLVHFGIGTDTPTTGKVTARICGVPSNK
jgi:alginate biosynthesis protein AlgX